MILSHKYGFIFIKLNKTAGTSVEIAMSKFCGDHDIITPISPEDEAIRRLLHHRGPQNYLAPVSDYSIKTCIQSVLRRRMMRRFFNHMSARDIKERVGDDIWNSYYKFCVVRNPWERIVSMYYWKHRNETPPPMSAFLESGYPRLLMERGYDLYTIEGDVVVDNVCRFENLEEEMRLLRRRLKLPSSIDLPRAKSGFRKDRRHAADILNATQKEKIRDMFSEEIRLFKYSI